MLHNARMIERKTLLTMRAEIDTERQDVAGVLDDDQALLAEIQRGLSAQADIIDAALKHLDFPLPAPETFPSR